MTLDVVVTDKGDRPIADLTKDEFRIVEDGREQTIKDFKLVTVPLGHAVVNTKLPPAIIDVATNAPPAESRVFVIVVDDLHLGSALTFAETLHYTKDIVGRFLEKLRPDDEVAMIFSGRSDLSQNFTRDRGRLVPVLDRVRRAIGGAGTGDGCGNTSATRNALFSLRNAAKTLATSGHARRAIVFISEGFPFNPQPVATDDRKAAASDSERIDRCRLSNFDSQTVIEEEKLVFDEAHRSNVPIYTINPHPVNDGGGGTEHLAILALNTGGRFWLNPTYLDQVVSEVVIENGTFYILGYSPDPVVRDGLFHDTKVYTSRPGTRVRARAGYVAPPATPPIFVPAKTLDDAMGAGLSVAGLPMRAFVAPVAATAKGMRTVVTVEIDYPAPSDGATTIEDDLEMSILALDPDAKIKASSRRPLHFKSPAPKQGSAAFIVNDVIDLPSEGLVLRVGLVSKALGKAGMAQISLDVPKPSDDQLQLTGIVLGPADSHEPVMRADVIKDLLPFQPTTKRVFAASDTLRIFTRALWKSKDNAVDVTVSIKDVRGAAPDAKHLIGAATPDGRRQAALDTTVSLKDLVPGRWALSVVAKLANGQIATREVAFEVR